MAALGHRHLIMLIWVCIGCFAANSASEPSAVVRQLGPSAELPAKQGELINDSSAPSRPRIVGGRDVEFGKAPWMASVSWFNGSDYKHLCGGVITDDSTILTALDCSERFQKFNIKELVVIMGFVKWAKNPPNKPRVERRVREIGDIRELPLGYVLLKEPLDFKEDYIKAIQLLEPGTKLAGSKAQFFGWGEVKPTQKPTRRMASHLQQLDVTILGSCPNRDSNDMVCAISKNGFPHFGDGGAPLVVERRGRKLLAGILYLEEGGVFYSIATSKIIKP